MATDITKTWDYPRKNPREEIVGLDGLIKAMFDLCGPNWDSSVFSPQFNNIRTGALTMSPHHCTYNDRKGHALTRKCFKDGHQSYCMEWMRVNGRRVRCGARLKVNSNGCGTHTPNSQRLSINLLIKNLVAGKIDSIAWEQLNDQEQATDSIGHKVDVTEASKQAILARHEEKLKELHTIGELPQGNRSGFNLHIAFEEDKKFRQRVEASDRKERQSTMRQKINKVSTNFIEAITSQSNHPRIKGKSNKSERKSVRPDASTFKNKRGGLNGSDVYV